MVPSISARFQRGIRWNDSQQSRRPHASPKPEDISSSQEGPIVDHSPPTTSQHIAREEQQPLRAFSHDVATNQRTEDKPQDARLSHNSIPRQITPRSGSTPQLCMKLSEAGNDVRYRQPGTITDQVAFPTTSDGPSEVPQPATGTPPRILSMSDDHPCPSDLANATIQSVPGLSLQVVDLEHSGSQEDMFHTPTEYVDIHKIQIAKPETEKHTLSKHDARNPSESNARLPQRGGENRSTHSSGLIATNVNDHTQPTIAETFTPPFKNLANRNGYGQTSTRTDPENDNHVGIVHVASPVVITPPIQVQPPEEANQLELAPNGSSESTMRHPLRPDGENGRTGSGVRAPSSEDPVPRTETGTANIMADPDDIGVDGLDEYQEIDKLIDVAGDDIIIAIMGPTGSGKSSFIGKVTGDVDVGVGHTLTSCTSEIKVTKCEVELANVILVDTPGFDDTKKSDLEILELISGWLKENYKRKVFLSAILYFHRITDNRMAGTPLKNLRVFEKLCGDDAMAQVVLVTTMWDEVERDVGEQRLQELRTSYWKGMISRGSTTFAYENTPDSARNFLKQVAEKSSERQHVLLQKEISELKKTLRETAAGQELSSRLEQLADQRLQALRKLRAETRKSADLKTTEDLRKEYADLKAQLDETLNQVHALRLSGLKAWFIRTKKTFASILR